MGCGGAAQRLVSTLPLQGDPRAPDAQLLAPHLHHREGLVFEGDVGGLPGAQEELGGKAAPQAEHVLLHGRVQAGRVLEVSPLPAVQDEAGEGDAELSKAALQPPRARGEAPTHRGSHLSSGLSTSTVTVCGVLWGFLSTNSKNSAVPSVAQMVCSVVMARLRALAMLWAFVRSR